MFVSATTAPNTTADQPITPATRDATGSSCFSLDGATSAYIGRLLDMNASHSILGGAGSRERPEWSRRWRSGLRLRGLTRPGSPQTLIAVEPAAGGGPGSRGGASSMSAARHRVKI